MKPYPFSIALFLLCAVLFTAAPAMSASVEAEGIAAVENRSIEQARTESLRMAQRNAVEQVLGIILTSETLVKNFVLLEDKILTRTQGYIKRYDMLSQDCAGGQCTSRIRAEVEEIRLADDVAALAGILPMMNYPTLVVTVRQQFLAQDLNKVPLEMATVEQAINGHLAQKGFRLAEPSALEAEKLRQASLAKAAAGAAGGEMAEALELAGHMAQVVVAGEAVVQDNGPSPFNERIHAYGAYLSAKAYETGTGKLLASANAEASLPHHSFAIGTQQAMNKAAVDLADQLSHQVVQAWLQSCYNEHEISMIVEGVEFGTVKAVQAAIARSIDGITRVNQKSFLRGQVELTVGWQNCNVNGFAEMAEGLAVNGGRLHVLEVQGNRIRLRYGR